MNSIHIHFHLMLRYDFVESFKCHIIREPHHTIMTHTHTNFFFCFQEHRYHYSLWAHRANRSGIPFGKFQLKSVELVQIRKWAPKFVGSFDIWHFGLIDQNVIRKLRCLQILRAENGPRKFGKRYESLCFKSIFDLKFQTSWQLFVSYIVLCSKYISFISKYSCMSSCYSVQWIAVSFHLACIFFSFSRSLHSIESHAVCYLFTNFPKSRSQIEYLKKTFRSIYIFVYIFHGNYSFSFVYTIHFIRKYREQ